MRMIGHSRLRHAIPFTPLLAAAALSIAIAASDKDMAAAAPPDSPDVSATKGPTDANTLRPIDGAGRTIRVVEVDSVVSGSEPDPESYDRAGLERWWRNYQLAHSLRAENSKK